MAKKKKTFEGFSPKAFSNKWKAKGGGKTIITEKQIAEAKAVFFEEGGRITRIKGRFNPELPMYAMDLDPREYGHN